MGSSQTETLNCRMDRAIARSIGQGRGLRFSRKDLTFEVNISCLLYGFLLCFCQPVIGPRALPEKNAIVVLSHETFTYLSVATSNIKDFVTERFQDFNSVAKNTL